jgi:hypothetical protein
MSGAEEELNVHRAFLEDLRSFSDELRGSAVAAALLRRGTEDPGACAGLWAMRVPSESSERTTNPAMMSSEGSDVNVGGKL